MVNSQNCYGKPDNQMLLKFGCETVRMPIPMDGITYLPRDDLNTNDTICRRW